MKLCGPFELELKVHMTDGDREAAVVCSMPMGQFPTEEVIRDLIAKSDAETKKQAGDDFRLMSKREFFDMIMRERTGTDMQFALPGGDEWDAP